ncbi:MAG: response regulator [Deltaproteobacteria bacterium]|nr:response regulator [Deltaproteobacteria bacterium]
MQEALEHKDGSWIWVLDRGKVIDWDENGSPLKMFGTRIDITERKLLEISRNELLAQRQAILENVPVGIAYSIDRRIIWCNSRLAEQFGYGLEDFDGKTPEFMFLSKEDYENFGSRAYPMLAKGEAFHTEQLLKRKDNSLIWCFMSGKAIDPDNSLRGSIWIIEDISKRKSDEEQLIKAREEALSANQAKSEFLANMSHEIRTPMNSVMGFADLLVKSQLDRKELEFACSIKQASSNLMFILNDILDLSKIEAGKFELEPMTFNLYDLCDQVIHTFGVLADKKGIRLSLEMSPELHVKLDGDPNRLRQILNNLVGNAVKFTSSGSVELVVTQYGTSPSLGETNTVTLIFAVKDTGIGVPAAQRERIFDPFTQVDASSRRKYGGTGLGLNICKKLVELMGGEIWVRNNEGAGSTFYFTACFELGHDAGPPLIGKEKRQPRSLRPLRILLAEDDVLSQRFTAEALRSQGHSVEIATNGKEVFNKLTTKPFDLILMDISMPDMDGTEVTKVIRRSTLNLFDPKIPIIAQTAHALKGDREKFLAAGMDGYITKPLDIDDLSAVIRQVMPHFVLEDGAGEGEKNPAGAMDERLPAFDNQALKTRFSGKKDLLSKLFDMFVEDIPSRISGLDASIDNGDFKALAHLAHTLKGSAATLAAIALTRCAANLQKFAQEEDLEAAKLCFPKLKAEVERLQAVSLEQLLARLNE